MISKVSRISNIIVAWIMLTYDEGYQSVIELFNSFNEGLKDNLDPRNGAYFYDEKKSTILIFWDNYDFINYKD